VTPIKKLLPLALVAAAVLATAPQARADIMTSCVPEIGKFCSSVSEGRGRVSACLASHFGSLGAGCRNDVAAVGKSPLTPRWVRPVFDPAFRAPLTQACATPAEQYSPGMTPGEGRVFACLYAYSDRVGKTCGSAAESALKQAR
jgi:hypothetical protein